MRRTTTPPLWCPRFWRLAALVFGALSLTGCGATNAPSYTLPESQRPAFWEIQDKDGTQVATLIGSVHMLPDGLDWVTPELKTAVAQCGVLVTEIGPSATETAQADWLAMAQDEPVAGITERLNQAQIERIQAMDLPIATRALDRTESWALALMAMQAQAPALGLETENGVEAILSDMAEKQSMPLLGLETAADQFARFNALPPKAQDAMLTNALTTPSDQQAEVQDMLSAWLSGDMAALLASMETGVTAKGALHQSLILAPNRKWAAAMETIIASGDRPCFAIGTAHLLGEGSIPALLTQRGYTITRAQ